MRPPRGVLLDFRKGECDLANGLPVGHSLSRRSACPSTRCDRDAVREGNVDLPERVRAVELVLVLVQNRVASADVG